MLIDDEKLNKLTSAILGCAIEVHRTLGPGLLESIYVTCFHMELAAQKLRFEAQRRIPITYKGAPVAGAYQPDLIVEGMVVVEVKSIEAIAPVHKAQVLTYLRLTGCPAGLLINFNAAKLMDGVKRLLNPTPPSQIGEQHLQ